MQLLRWLPALFALGFVWQSTEPPKPPKPLKRGPLAYYRDHCQRCHGEFGGAYEDNFTKGKTTEELTAVIKSMAAGEGGSPLTDENELKAQVAFHYAIDLKQPFLSWTGIDGKVLTGEATPKATLSATVSGSKAGVELKNGVWSVVLPAGEDPKKLVITAALGDAKCTLNLSKAAFSQPERKKSIPNDP